VKNTYKLPSHHELEKKYEVTGLFSASDFVKRCYQELACAASHKYVSSDDVYYRRGKSVCRFRVDGDRGCGGELTVKLRTSKKSIANRVEVDIRVSKRTTDADVRAFLAATGWETDLVIHKCADIIHVNAQMPPGAPTRAQDASIEAMPVILAYYVVTTPPSKGKRRKAIDRVFLEVEVDKDVIQDLKAGQKLLNLWEHGLRLMFPLSKPLNASLYELYTGRRYAIAK
jgi:hypothetical protein